MMQAGGCGGLGGGGDGRLVTHQELSGAVRGQDPDLWLGGAGPASCHLSAAG